MAKVTIVFEDLENEIDVQTTFEPRWHNPLDGGVETPAQALAMHLMQYMSQAVVPGSEKFEEGTP
jgi:hypothetical protein